MEKKLIILSLCIRDNGNCSISDIFSFGFNISSIHNSILKYTALNGIHFLLAVFSTMNSWFVIMISSFIAFSQSKKTSKFIFNLFKYKNICFPESNSILLCSVYFFRCRALYRLNKRTMRTLAIMFFMALALECANAEQPPEIYCAAIYCKPINCRQGTVKVKPPYQCCNKCKGGTFVIIILFIHCKLIHLFYICKFMIF